MGKHAATKAREIKRSDNLILSSTMLAIDPASNTMGYAVFHKGKKIDGGVLEGQGDNVFERLQDLHSKLRILSKRAGPISVLVIEEIRGRMAHAYLMWSVGMTIAAVGADLTIEMPITLWKSQTPADYVKTDAKDAEMIGQTVLNICRSKDGKIEALRPQRIRKTGRPKKREPETKTTRVSDEKRFSKTTGPRRRKPERRDRRGSSTTTRRRGKMR